MIADRWGVTDDEVSRHYPCDDIVPRPALQAWRGVDVRATPHQLWPWVTQLRLGPYSYDWLDNLGHRSPDTLQDLPEPVVGQPFTSVGGGRPIGVIRHVSPGESFTGEILGSVLSYVVVPVGPAHSRLLMKIVLRRYRLLAPLVSAGDLVMARRQLLNLAAHAETAARQ